MHRSRINALIRDGMDFCRKMGFYLPPFAYWSYEQYKQAKNCDEIFDNMLGWDVTDFGSGDFDKTGLLLFTLRNGSLNDKRYPKPYAEKILIQNEGQMTPMHFHFNKMEDIIVRGGGNLVVTLYDSDENGGLSDSEFYISVDACKRLCRPGEEVVLKPGQSITLLPGQYHSFRTEEGSGRVLLGEVSAVNDDRTDNRFYEPISRLPEVEEDEPIEYPLFVDCLKLTQTL